MKHHLLVMLLGFNKTTLVPQSIGTRELRSHLHESTVLKNTAFLFWSVVTSHQYVQPGICNRIYSNHKSETSLCCSLPSQIFDSSTYSNKAFRSDFLYGSDTSSRISEHPLPTRNWARLINVLAVCLHSPPLFTATILCLPQRKSDQLYCFDQLAMDSKL